MTLCAGSVTLATADETTISESGSLVAEQPGSQTSDAIPFLAPNAAEVDSAPAGSRTAAVSFIESAVQDSVKSSETQPRRIGEIRPSFDYAWGDVAESTLPEDFSVNTDDDPVDRVIGTPLLLQWQPSNLWYHPLYFEDPVLERYGHTYSPLVQSLVSTGRFVGQAATLPYHATLRPMWSREYPLGWYRPGERAPYLKYRPAWNDEAAVNQALAITGLILLIP